MSQSRESIKRKTKYRSKIDAFFKHYESMVTNIKHLEKTRNSCNLVYRKFLDLLPVVELSTQEKVALKSTYYIASQSIKRGDILHVEKPIMFNLNPNINLELCPEESSNLFSSYITTAGKLFFSSEDVKALRNTKTQQYERLNSTFLEKYGQNYVKYALACQCFCASYMRNSMTLSSLVDIGERYAECLEDITVSIIKNNNDTADDSNLIITYGTMFKLLFFSMVSDKDYSKKLTKEFDEIGNIRFNKNLSMFYKFMIYGLQFLTASMCRVLDEPSSFYYGIVCSVFSFFTHHSCDHNTVLFKQDDLLVFVATRDIEQGEKIVLNITSDTLPPLKVHSLQSYKLVSDTFNCIYGGGLPICGCSFKCRELANFFDNNADVSKDIPYDSHYKEILNTMNFLMLQSITSTDLHVFKKYMDSLADNNHYDCIIFMEDIFCVLTSWFTNRSTRCNGSDYALGILVPMASTFANIFQARIEWFRFDAVDYEHISKNKMTPAQQQISREYALLLLPCFPSIILCHVILFAKYLKRNNLNHKDEKVLEPAMKVLEKEFKRLKIAFYNISMEAYCWNQHIVKNTIIRSMAFCPIFDFLFMWRHFTVNSFIVKLIDLVKE